MRLDLSERKQLSRLVDDVWYILNYKRGDEPLAAYRKFRFENEFKTVVFPDGHWEPPEESIEDAVTYDPDAWTSLTRGAEMLEAQRALRRFIDTWIAANFVLANWECRREIESCLQQRGIALRTDSGGKVDFYIPLPSDIPHRGYIEAVELAFSLVVSPQPRAIRKCPECRNYVLVNRSDKKYCSPKCASNFSARDSIRETRKRRKDSKLELIRKSCKELDKKQKGVRQLEGPLKVGGVTHKFITRARNKGLLNDVDPTALGQLQRILKSPTASKPR